MAWRSDERELVLGFSAHYQDLYPVEIYDWSEIQRPLHGPPLSYIKERSA